MPWQQVDVLVSEPMGTLLVNERMLETYIIARDRFLKPGGKMFPVRHLCSILQALKLKVLAAAQANASSRRRTSKGSWMPMPFSCLLLLCAAAVDYRCAPALAPHFFIHFGSSVHSVMRLSTMQQVGRIHLAAFSDESLYNEVRHGRQNLKHVSFFTP
jgi:hypothetical protein